MIRVLRTVLIASLGSLASCLSGASSVNLYGGVRELSDGSLDDVDQPPYYGIDAVFAQNDEGLLGLAGEVGYGHSDESDSALIEDVEIDIDEFYGGLRLFFPLVPLVKPYASAGLSWVDAEFQDGIGASYSDDGVVPYVRAGLAGQVALFRFGVDFRYLFESDLDLGPVDEVDGWISSLFVGIAF